MKNLALVLFLITFFFSLQAQNVGIGIDAPASRLQLHQNTALSDPLSALLLTNSTTGSTASDGLKLFSSTSDGSLMNFEPGKLQLGTNGINRINIMSSGKVGFNTEAIIGASDITLKSSNQFGFGGMYIDTDDAISGKPFYGYAVNGLAKVWQYYDQATSTLKVYNNGDRLALKDNGHFGIKSMNPAQTLSVNGKIEIGDDSILPTDGSIKYAEEDFQGYVNGEWKSLTTPDKDDILSFDDYLDFEFCNSPSNYWLNNTVHTMQIEKSCGVIYDSGGPSGNYSNGEDYYVYFYSDVSTQIKVIIDELQIESDYDTLKIGTFWTSDYIYTSSLSSPDTILLPSNYLSISFDSDNSVNSSGFKIRWEFVAEAAPSVNQFTGYYYDVNQGALAAGSNHYNKWDTLGTRAIAFGVSTSASGDYGISLGSSATASGYASAAVGPSSYALGYASTAIGLYSNADKDYSTALGYNANVTANGTVIIGSTTVASIGGYQNWSNLSDGRFKSNVKENIPGLDFINQLRPVTYQLDIDKLNRFVGNVNHESKDGKIDKYKTLQSAQIRSGFIAQEVEELARSLNYDFSGIYAPESEEDHYALRYAEFVVPLVKAVQELNEENKALRKKLDDLLRLEVELDELKAAVGKLRAN